jgi:hypothetical protein
MGFTGPEGRRVKRRLARRKRQARSGTGRTPLA